MFDVTDRLRSAAAAGGLVAITGALAVMGLVWITFAAFTALTDYVSPAVSMMIVGLSLIAPLVVVLLQHRVTTKAKPEPVADVPPPGEIAALAKLVSSAQSLSERSPLASTALALGAAYVASRSTATSGLTIQIIAEVVDQWAKAKAAAPQAANPASSDAPHDDPSI